jgi:branched-chain amino acid aminotransferase
MVQQHTAPTAAAAPGGYRQRYLWVSGQMKPWEECTVHQTMVGWSSLFAVFEGIRAYRSASGRLHVFGLMPHMQRFLNSIKVMRMASPWSAEELAAAVVESIRVNGLEEDCYIQPVAYPEGGINAAPLAAGRRPDIYIPVRPNPSQLLTDRAQRCNITSWVRVSDRNLPPRVKAIPNYQNSRVAQLESQLSGFDAPIFLNEHGKVAEGGGACIAMVRDGKVVTPPVTASILESITRGFFLQMIPEVLGIPMVEREIDRTELYICQEAFFFGTGAEVTPIVGVDHHAVGTGAIGPVTRRIQRAYHDVVRAIDSRYTDWRTPV